MHPSTHAASHPDKPAIIVAETGAVISYAELDAASNRAAQLFRAHGLGVFARKVPHPRAPAHHLQLA